MFEDPISELRNLVETSRLQEYLDSFDTLLNKVHVSKEYVVGLFLGGQRLKVDCPI